MKDLEKKVLNVWRFQGLFTALLLSLPVLLVATAASDLSTGFTFWAISIVILSAIMLLYMQKRYGNWSYEFRKDHLYLEHGVLKKVNTMVPFIRIQHVDTQRNIIERIAGISSIVVYTAGSRGADVTIPGLKPEDAESMQEKLRDVAIESEDRDAV